MGGPITVKMGGSIRVKIDNRARIQIIQNIEVGGQSVHLLNRAKSQSILYPAMRVLEV